MLQEPTHEAESNEAHEASVMNAKQSASQKIARIVAKHEDRTFYSHYTGRFMYSRACPGIVCSPYDVAKAITAVKRAITGKVTYCTDNMGLDMVVYFSGLMSDPVSGTVPQTVEESDASRLQ